DAIAIDVRAASQHVSDTVHDVDVSLAAPIATDLVDKLLAIADRAARIRREHDVARVGKHLRVPAVTPRITPRALWATVNQHDKRVTFARVEIIGFDYEPVNLTAECARPLDV